RLGPMNAPTAGAPDLDHRWNHHASLQAAADQLVLGRRSNGHRLKWHLGAAAAAPARFGSYKTAWLICAKLRQNMLAPGRSPISPRWMKPRSPAAAKTIRSPAVAAAAIRQNSGRRRRRGGRWRPRP